MTTVSFYRTAEDKKLKFAVIFARTKGKWVFCRHKERTTYEIPGGHREVGESILEAAKRELREETGAIDFTIEPVCVYSVSGKAGVEESQEESFGMLYLAEIQSFEEELHSEIEEIIITDKLPEEWTYPEIQPKLFEQLRKRGIIV